MNHSADKRSTVSTASDTVRVVQLTDTHLCREPGGKLLSMDTDHSLQAVVEQVRVQRPVIDVVLGTGDLSDRGALEAYRRVESYFAQLPGESFWLPGNHDDRAQMAAAATSSSRLSGEVLAGNWQLLLLDSQVPGEVGGELGAAQLQRLEQALQWAQDNSRYTLVCLHHQPVTIGCEWLDEQMVADADAFWAHIDRFPGVRGVLWGHVHQQIDRRRGDIALMASPSTCVQFKPGSDKFRADDQAPGYRWLDLASDGTLSTGVSRVTDVEFTVDLESGGYL